MPIDRRLQDYLHALASEQSTPGGGSAAALSGAMGAALASMVCRLTLGKEAYAGVRQEIEELLRRAENLRSRFQQLFQEDIEAYGRLSASYKLPRETSEERAAELVQCCQRIAEIGNAAVLSDVAIGAILASGAGEGAALLVRFNLRAMKNDELVGGLGKRLSGALALISEGRQRVTAIVGDRA